MAYALMINDSAIELQPGRGFTDAEGVTHPAEALTPAWTDAERAAVGVYEIQEHAPPAVGFRHTVAQVTALMGKPVRRALRTAPIPIHELRAPRHQRREAMYRAAMARGLEVTMSEGLIQEPTIENPACDEVFTQHIALDAESLAHLGNMLAVAGAAKQGLVPWPAEYMRGWVTIEGGRYPLPTPEDGAKLAHDAIALHSALVHTDQDLHDQIEAADSFEALNRILP